MGRHYKGIDKEQFENLCALQCTRDEICSWFDITDKTLNSWCKRTYKDNFSAVFKQKRGKGKISLRRTQWQLAERSASMAIWLGKQYLGQKDIIEVGQGNDKIHDDALSASLREMAAELKSDKPD